MLLCQIIAMIRVTLNSLSAVRRCQLLGHNATDIVASERSVAAAGEAPSFVIVGSYFPGWMFCALIGIVLAIAVRVGFVASGLAEHSAVSAVRLCPIGLCGGTTLWLLWFGH